MSEAIGCDNFVQNAWRKDLCTNCQKHRSQHPASPKRDLILRAKPHVKPAPRKSIRKSSSSELIDLENGNEKSQEGGEGNVKENTSKTGAALKNGNCNDSTTTESVPDKDSVVNEKSGGAIPKLKRTESKPATSPKPEIKRNKECKPKPKEKPKVGFQENDPDIIGYDGGVVFSDSVDHGVEPDSAVTDQTETKIESGTSLTEEEKEVAWQTLQNTRRNSSHLPAAGDTVKLRKPSTREKSSNSNKRRSREFEDLEVQLNFETGRFTKISKPSRPFGQSSSGRKSPPPRVSVKPFLREIATTESEQPTCRAAAAADSQYRVPTSNQEISTVNTSSGDPYQIPISNQAVRSSKGEPFYHTYDVGQRASSVDRSVASCGSSSKPEPQIKHIVQPYTVVDISKNTHLTEPDPIHPPRLPSTPAPEASCTASSKSSVPSLAACSPTSPRRDQSVTSVTSSSTSKKVSGHLDRQSASSAASESPKSSPQSTLTRPEKRTVQQQHVSAAESSASSDGEEDKSRSVSLHDEEEKPKRVTRSSDKDEKVPVILKTQVSQEEMDVDSGASANELASNSEETGGDFSRMSAGRASLGKSAAFEAKMAAIAHNLDLKKTGSKKLQQTPMSDKPVRKERDRDKIPQRHHSDVGDSARPTVTSPTSRKKASSLPSKAVTVTKPETEAQALKTAEKQDKTDKTKRSGGKSFFKKFLKIGSKEAGHESAESVEQSLDSVSSEPKIEDTASDLSDSEGDMSVSEPAQPFSPSVKPRLSKTNTGKDVTVQVIPGVMGEIYGEQTPAFNAELKKALSKTNAEGPRQTRAGSTEDDDVEATLPSPKPSILSPSKTDKICKFDNFTDGKGSGENHTETQKMTHHDTVNHHKTVRIVEEVKTLDSEEQGKKQTNSDLEQKHDQIRSELEQKLPHQKPAARKPTTVPPSPPIDRLHDLSSEGADQECGSSSTGGTDSVGSLEEEYYGSCDDPLYPSGVPRRRTVKRMRERPPPPPDPVRRKSCAEGAEGGHKSPRPPSMPIEPPPPPVETVASLGMRPMSTVEGVIGELSHDKNFRMTLPTIPSSKPLQVSTDEVVCSRRKQKSAAKHARNRTLSEGIKLEVEWDEEFKLGKKGAPVIRHPHLDMLTRALPSPPQEIPPFTGSSLRNQSHFDDIQENIYDLIDNYQTIGNDKPVLSGEQRPAVKQESVMSTSSEYLEPIRHPQDTRPVSPVEKRPAMVGRQHTVLGIETSHAKAQADHRVSAPDKSPDDRRPRPAPRRRPQQKPPPPGGGGSFMTQTDSGGLLYANREIELERVKPATNMAEGFRKMATMNLEVLQEISEELISELVQVGSRPRADLTWKDFVLVSDEAMCLQGGMVFHAAKERKNDEHDCVLMISLSPLHPDMLHLSHVNIIRAAASFHDKVPTECLPDQKDEDLYSLYGTVQATVAVLNCSAILCLEDYMAGIHYLYEHDPIPYERNVCYILVQLLNGILYLKTKGYPLPCITTKDVLVMTPTDRDEKNIVLNPFSNQLQITSRSKRKKSITEEVESIIAELLQIIPDPELEISAQISGGSPFSRGFQKVAHVLHTLDQHPLTIARNIVEFLLWGPQEDEIKTLSLAEDREQAFSVWLELERCKMLNRFARTTLSSISIEERNHIKFLCRTTGFTLFDTTKLLHK